MTNPTFAASPLAGSGWFTSPATNLVNKVRNGMMKQAVQEAIHQNLIAHCAVCHKPFPGKNPAETYTCRQCQQSQQEAANEAAKIIEADRQATNQEAPIVKPTAQGEVANRPLILPRITL